MPEQVPEETVLSARSSVTALKGRPIYGTKDEHEGRLGEREATAEPKARERQWIEAREKELMEGEPADADDAERAAGARRPRGC